MPSTPSTLARRACDSCKRRKTKCDATTPMCANCRISGIECTYNIVARKRGPKPVRSGNQETFEDSYLSPPNINQAPQPEGLTNTHGLNTQTSPSESCPPAWAGAQHVIQPTKSRNEALELHRMLVEQLKATLGSDMPIVSLVQELISLFTQYSFPTGPICHETSLRADASWIFGTTDCGTQNLSSTQQWREATMSGDMIAQLRAMRRFALVTGLCGGIIHCYQHSPIMAYPSEVGDIFFNISKKMLNLYEDFDVENPDSSSLTVRIFHSVAHQHSTGQTSTTTFIHGQACILAQSLCLHDKSVYGSYDSIEAQLLRHNFWQLYTSDQAAAVLRSRPFTLHELLYESPITVEEPGAIPAMLLDQESAYHQPPFEERLVTGYRLSHRMRSLAADLTLGIRTHSRRFNSKDGMNLNEAVFNQLKEADLCLLANQYINFTCVIDDTPSWIASPDTIGEGDETVRSYQRESFWMQRSLWFTTFHCIRMTILHQCSEHGLVSILGLNDDPLSLSLKKTEIARDYVLALEDIPFHILQVSGEHCVEQIRRVGSIILQLTENETNAAILESARMYLSRLINVLSRLDSKASFTLTSRQDQDSLRRKSSQVAGT